MEERFEYNDMNRLAGITLKRPSGQDFHCAVTYDANRHPATVSDAETGAAVWQATATDRWGNVTDFTGGGIHVLRDYDDVTGLVEGISARKDGRPLFGQACSWSSTGNLEWRTDTTLNLRETFAYDRFNRLVSAYAKNLSGTVTHASQGVQFDGKGNVTGKDGVTKKMHYLTSASGLFAIFVSTSNNGGIMYHTIKDHQGSLAATVHGNAVERLSYDPWGRRRNTSDFGYSNVSHTFDRGYTFHEHYDGFDLINMKFTLSERSAKLCLSTAERCELGGANGRLYDPILGRMLSPDIVVQDEQNSQAYNRYSYCFNNPLRFTDPSGYVVRGSRNYFDWNSMVYYDFGNYRSNGSAFNTELSEGKFSPIYDVNGYFLGTDDEGLQGEAIVMRREDFRQVEYRFEHFLLASQKVAKASV